MRERQFTARATHAEARTAEAEGTRRALHLSMMNLRTAQVITALTCLTLGGTVLDASAGQRSQRNRPRGTSGIKPVKRVDPPAAKCGDPLAFQVLLDRQGFSPGQIDGSIGSNFSHAVSAFQTARKLKETGQADCETWEALGGTTPEAALTTYTVTDQDLAGPFEEKIPKQLAEQAKLPSLGYQTALEKLAERFHASPGLITKLNPGPLAAGRQIRVPDVTPFDVTAKPAAPAASKPPANAGKPPAPAAAKPTGTTGAKPTPAAPDVTIQVTKADSALRIIGADGNVMFFAPVTTGSEHDPLPTGDYKVIGVSWMPPFHYNPDLFWDAKATDEKATIKPGPNNPVGVTWISLSLDHYGIHGTPEPGNVGHTESHGCVRLTNWDAARVVALVKAGTPVQFR
jgi:lipoprotein-anchoring transpeptidase ErfK/SrfK